MKYYINQYYQNHKTYYFDNNIKTIPLFSKEKKVLISLVF